MHQPVYKIIELVGTSHASIEEAIKSTIEKAAQSIKNLDWFQVIETRGCIENHEVKHYQVVLKVGFRVEEHKSDE